MDNYWLGETVFVTVGKGFGVHPSGKSICLGTEQSIKDILAAGKAPRDITGAIKETYESILIIEKELAYGKSKSSDQFKASRVHNFRNRPARGFENRAINIKRTSSGKSFPGHKVKRQKSGLSN